MPLIMFILHCVAYYGAQVVQALPGPHKSLCQYCTYLGPLWNGGLAKEIRRITVAKDFFLSVPLVPKKIKERIHRIAVPWSDFIGNIPRGQTSWNDSWRECSRVGLLFTRVCYLSRRFSSFWLTLPDVSFLVDLAKKLIRSPSQRRPPAKGICSISICDLPHGGLPVLQVTVASSPSVDLFFFVIWGVDVHPCCYAWLISYLLLLLYAALWCFDGGTMDDTRSSLDQVGVALAPRRRLPASWSCLLYLSLPRNILQNFD